MADDKQVSTGVFPIQRIPNPNRQTFYANNTFVAGNQWDIQFYFSLVHEITPGQFGAVEETLVIMTPEHALAFSKALEKALAGYSASQGGIRDIKSPELPAPSEKTTT